MILHRAATSLRPLRRDRRAVALLEFALSAPFVLALGLYGIEIANEALTHMRISQIALNLADNASRVGVLGTTNVETLREGDINDILQAARIQGSGIDLGVNGRVIISSLENIQQSYDTAPVQRIHWQRCIGKQSGTGYTSSYGTTLVTDGTTTDKADKGTDQSAGMGDANAKVSAPAGSGLIFVEVNYLYKPRVSRLITSPFRIHYTASLIVRNNRDFKKIDNLISPANRATCNLYNA
ncbi:MAG: hypothetical protein EOP89_15340 [Lysobacteraceae bacterium]|nr:MAG: hypothetical protein EOP89_15340 [Xanthomonadaceae bacterium]